MKLKIIILLILYSITLNADQFSFLFYNDVFAKTDKHFTNGACLSWLQDSNSTLLQDIIDTLPLTVEKNQQHSIGMSISQVIITPADTTKTTPQYNDFPYVGYLALSFYMFEWNNRSFDEIRMEFGVFGKESGVEKIQNKFHAATNIAGSKGWDTQLGTQYTANLLYRYGNKSWESHNQNSLSKDWFNHFGLEAGNFAVDAFGGTMFRVGRNYRRNFNVHYPYMKEEASLLHPHSEYNDDLGWSFSFGINGELLAYSHIIDESKKDGYEIQNNLLSISIYTGADIYYKAHKMTLFYQSQTPDTKKEDRLDIIGGFMYSYQF